MATHDPVDARERGIGELVKDLASQTSTLVRQEIKLAQAELTERGKVAGRGAGLMAGAAVAALIVTVVWLIVATVLAMTGKKSLQASTPPVPQTVETVKEDIQWAKNPTGSAPR